MPNPNKVTLATVKAFIKNNSNNLYAKTKSSFDGMTDCVQNVEGACYEKVDPTSINMKDECRLGISQLWFVRGSRDNFRVIEDAKVFGYEINNSCGTSMIVKIKDATRLPGWLEALYRAASA